MRSEENINSEISFKKRELERAKISLKQLSRDEEDLNNEINELKEDIEDKQDDFGEEKKTGRRIEQKIHQAYQ